MIYVKAPIEVGLYRIVGSRKGGAMFPMFRVAEAGLLGGLASALSTSTRYVILLVCWFCLQLVPCVEA